MSIQIPSGEDIKNLRKSYGLTQKDLAGRAGVSQSLIARIEAGKVDPRLSTLKKILNSILTLKSEKDAAGIMHSPVIYINSKDSVRSAVDLMENHGISQLPVLEEGIVVGSLNEGTLIRKIFQSKNPDKIFNAKIADVMDEPFPTMSLNSPLDEILTSFTRDKPAVLVVDKGKPVGIITKIDIVTAVRSTK